MIAREAGRCSPRRASVSKRQRNRVYFDYLQNGKSKTIAAPYVLRAYPGAPVATPLEWNEVQRGLHPSQFNIATPSSVSPKKATVPRRAAQPQHLDAALERLAALY